LAVDERSDQVSSVTPSSLPHTDDSSLKHLLDSDRAAHRSGRRRILIVTVLILIFLAWFIPFIPALYFGSISVKRLDAKGKVTDSEVGPATQQWVPIKKVSRHVINAIIVAEDSKFYQHHGFDFEAIAKAIDLNRKRGRYVRGASTISQQVVKMAFLSREKTLIRKFREAAGTVVLELLMPKDKILEWYINLCEFGGGIYGVKPAGRFYFKTRPELLTIEQAVHLAVVIPSPNKWSKGLRAGALTPFGHRRFARIVNNLYLGGYINELQKNMALARGNFGNPIAGYGPLDDDEDCRGDKECEEGAADTSIPNEVPAVVDEKPDVASSQENKIQEETKITTTPENAATSVQDEKQPAVVHPEDSENQTEEP